MTAVNRSALLVAVFGMALSTQATAAPLIFFFDGDSGTGFITDTNTSTATPFTTFQLAYPVAVVNGNLRVHDRDDAVGGVEYDANGNPTGLTWSGNGTAVSQLLDGTSDGIHNYAIQCCSMTNFVWQADLLWQNLVPLFALPQGESSITYDSASGTLFTTDFSGGLYEYSLTGTLLNTYLDGGGFNAGLSYDAATDTLWGTRNGSTSVFQESTTGVILQQLTIESLEGSNIFAGEIINAAVGEAPEPGTMLLAGAALLGLSMTSRRRKSR